MSDQPTKRGVPKWMARLGIKRGGFLCLTKGQLESLIRPGKPLKQQFWAVGMLHTAGYQGEMAVRLVNNVIEPMTPSQISIALVDHWLRYFEKSGIDTSPLLSKAPEALLKRFDQPISQKDQRFIKRYLLRVPKEDLRSIMEELECEGVMARSVSDGRLLQEIPVEKRKFVSGKLRIAFFARPRQPKSQLVKEQWDYTLSSIPTPDTYNPEVKVGKKSLPPPSVPQIVRVFGLQVERKRLADPAYQKTVQDAYGEAKKVFLDRIAQAMPNAATEPEVGNTALPPVAPAAPPEVGKKGERFERKVERHVERFEAQSSSAVPIQPVERRESVKEKELTTTTPPADGGYASDRDELVALMQSTIGHPPSAELVRKICERLELRGITLRLYLDDTKPRLDRLTTPAREGFYYQRAKLCGTAEEQPAAAPETVAQKEKRTGPCPECRGLGKVGDEYCSCPMGLDLKKVEKRKVSAAGGESC